MKLASIVPVKNIARTFDGDYAMLLAHLKDYYPKNPNKNCYTIMDNSLIELGGAVDIKTVYEAAEQCQVNEFILPDVFQDGEATVKRVVKDIEWLSSEGIVDKFRLMAVCHGKTFEEFVNCFYELESIPEIHCIGIPKVVGTWLGGGRPALEDLWKGSPKAIHLLGCTKNLNEFRQYKNPAAIRSCDTCIPALLSTKGYNSAWEDRPEKTIDLFNDEVDRWTYGFILSDLRRENLL